MSRLHHCFLFSAWHKQKHIVHFICTKMFCWLWGQGQEENRNLEEVSVLCLIVKGIYIYFIFLIKIIKSFSVVNRAISVAVCFSWTCTVHCNPTNSPQHSLHSLTLSAVVSGRADPCSRRHALPHHGWAVPQGCSRLHAGQPPLWLSGGGRPRILVFPCPCLAIDSHALVESC